MTKKAKVLQFPKPIGPKPAIREKLLQAELEHVRKMARNALYKYGMHGHDCPARLLLDTKDECTCGLYATINMFYAIPN